MKDLYEYLKKFRLCNRDTLNENISRLTENEIGVFLGGYIDISNKNSVRVDVLAGATDVYPDSQSAIMSTDTIRRLSLIVNRIYVHDCLLESALDWLEVDSIHRKAHDFSRESRVQAFRQNLYNRIDLLLEIQPIVIAGIVRLLPTELMYSRKDPNGIYAEDFVGLEEALPEGGDIMSHPLISKEVYSYMESKISLKLPVKKGASILRIEDLVDCPNIISILLGDQSEAVFRYFTVKALEGMNLEMVHSNDPYGQDIDSEMFQKWVKRSIESIIIDYVERLHNDVVLSEKSKARFLTDLPISHGLLRANYQRDRSILGILNMELPYFDNVNFESIAKARQNEIAFEDFRSAIDKAIQQIPNETEPKEFQDRLDELSRDLLRVPLLKIKKENQRLARNLFVQGIVGVGTLGLYCVNPLYAIPGGLLTAANLLAGTYDKNKPSQDKIREMPGYFYWDATRNGVQRYIL